MAKFDWESLTKEDTIKELIDGLVMLPDHEIHDLIIKLYEDDEDGMLNLSEALKNKYDEIQLEKEEEEENGKEEE